MTARQAREVLALLETAVDLLAQAREVVAMSEVGTYPEGGRKERLKLLTTRAMQGTDLAADTCRVVLGMEERYAARKVGAS